MEILTLIIRAFSLVVTLYLLLSGLYFLIFSVANLFYKESDIKKIYNRKTVGIFIPAYKEDSVIIESAVSAKKHISSRANCEVIVVADQLQSVTMDRLLKEKITVIEVKLEKSSKSKALKYAISQIKRNYDYAVILDADNIMADKFIDHIIEVLNNNYLVVQGQRTAKNTNTGIAGLDAYSEAINNSIFRTGHRTMGLSASLIGSGFAIDYTLFKKLLSQTSSIGGFDKELELMLLIQGIRIGYAKNAIVFDEKVHEEKSFVNQRRRWLSAQFVYLFSNPSKSIGGDITFDYIDKKIQFIVPPRVLAIGVSFILYCCFLFISFFTNSYQIITVLSGLAALVNISAVLLAIPRHLYNKRNLQSLKTLPKGFLLTLIALFKIKNANKQFIHTTHGLTK